MRLPVSALAITAILSFAACGDDEPQETPLPQSGSQQVADTAGADTTRPEGAVRGEAGQSPEAAPGEGGAPGRADQAQAGDPGDAGAPGEAGTPGEAGDAGEGRVAGQPGDAQAADGAGRTAEGRLYTTQVAAFVSPDSARKWTGRLRSLDLPAWTSMTELEGRTYYRVRVGAVSDVNDARRLGALLTERFEWPVWVTAVTPSDPIPEDAVASTRRVLGD